MSAANVVWLDDAEHASAAVLGGKFGSLAEMTRSGFAVPPGFAVTTAAYRRFEEENGGLAAGAAAARAVDPDDLAAVQAASAEMAAAIEAAPLPADVDAAIREAYARLEQAAEATGAPVAVRSSGVAEDLGGASFAGQYETFLWIRGADEVLRHVRRCWTGLFSAPVLTYRPPGGEAPAEAPGMAVGVQQMVLPRAAGVMFTLDPINGDRSKVVIEGAWGLGEAVVGGEVTPDRYRVDKVTFEVLAREISTKEVECRFDPEAGGVAMLPVPEERRSLSCLDDEHVVALATLGKRIERHRGAPVDVEWAVDERGRVHVLQVRPETVWSQKRKAPAVAGAGSSVERVLAKFMAGVPKAPSGKPGGNR
jgi:pyruvate,water dikinase